MKLNNLIKTKINIKNFSKNQYKLINYKNKKIKYNRNRKKFKLKKILLIKYRIKIIIIRYNKNKLQMINNIFWNNNKLI